MGKRKIVISEFDNIAALLEDDRAIEFIIHRGDMLLGDVYLATVENILPSIDAAFVNVGGDKMGFLHSSDVPGKGDLKGRLEPKQQVVVQVMKEPTGHKGPRVTTNISLPGRFLVMMPESKGISISRKIQESAERSRLKSIVSLVKPPGVGVIIRTEATNQKESDITEDFETLLERWQNIVSMSDTSQAPTLLYRDQDLLYRVIREAVTEDVVEIVVDSAFGAQRAQQLLTNWNMDKNIKVTQYQGSQPVLVGTGVDKEIKLALQTKVPLPSGGYLYIQPTEALCVIDVNSGKFTSLQSQAETIKLTNLEACREIARQLRLRNIGGMIVVDFIDMESRANQLAVLETFENELAPDKSKPQIGQLSDLGLVEMTRHRQGQALSEIFTKRCHSCGGTGHAMEEFTWMHNAMDPDNRGQGRHQSGRNKLPTRQPQRMQQVPKPNASARNQQQKGGRVNLDGIVTPKGGEARNPNQAVPGNIFLTNKNGDPNKKPQDNGVNLTEYYSDQIFKKLGVRFSQVAKLAYTPIEINGILTRINPKANDIVTLVQSIEQGATMPMPIGGGMPSHFAGMSGDDDDEEGGDDDEGGEEKEPRAQQQRPDRRGGRPEQRGGQRVQQQAPEAFGDDADAEAEAEAPTPRQLEIEELDEAVPADDVDEAEVVEEDEDEPVARPRAKRPVPKRAEVAEVVEADAPDEDADDDEDFDGADEGDGDDEEGEAEGAGSAVATAEAPRGIAKRRRGRPPKRMKRPPAKPAE